MTQHQDPSTQWAEQLGALDPRRRVAVVEALAYSISTGWPASERAVELLVDYARGAITAAAYSTGIARSLGLPELRQAAQAAGPAARAMPFHGRSRCDHAVQSYLAGRIDVGEFLRLAFV